MWNPWSDEPYLPGSPAWSGTSAPNGSGGVYQWPEGVVVQNWHDAQVGKKIVNANHRTIFSPWNVSGAGWRKGWYLDQGGGGPWEEVYLLDPAENFTAVQEALVLGGEACLWGENVDASDIFVSLWPRLAAIAERLWSPRNKTTDDLNRTRARLQRYRCLLLQRGVGAAPLGGGMRDVPPGPGACTQLASLAGSSSVVRSPRVFTGLDDDRKSSPAKAGRHDASYKAAPAMFV